MRKPVFTESFRAASPIDDSDPERKWLREVYQGDNSRQLTVRAVVAGMLLGGVMSLSNLYIALKTGWSFGVTITAGILAFVIFNVLKRVGVGRDEFGMLENNAMQSVASAAGYMTGGGTVAAIPALMLATHTVISGWTIFFWITPIAMLGVFMAIPMKRQMINQEGLKFPSGIAAAETLRGLHPEEAAKMDARRSDKPSTVVDAEGTKIAGRALIWSAGVGALVLWLREARARWIPFNLPEHIAFPFSIRGVAAMKWSVFFDTSLLLIAAGAIMGWRSAWSMMLGGLINYFALAPHGFDIHEIAEVKIRAISQWTVWFGSPLLLTSGLLSFAFSWRQIARAFSGLSGIFSRAKPVSEDPMAAVEVPIQWFVYGISGLTPLVMFFAWKLFGIAWWMSLLCVVMSFFIAIVACRATGETDTTPTGALGKITQLVFGVVAPGSITTNLIVRIDERRRGDSLGGHAYGPQVRPSARREASAAVHRAVFRRPRREPLRGARVSPARAGLHGHRDTGHSGPCGVGVGGRLAGALAGHLAPPAGRARDDRRGRRTRRRDGAHREGAAAEVSKVFPLASGFRARVHDALRQHVVDVRGSAHCARHRALAPEGG